jgi:Na+-translocating ferredoxin:NAD+ oxidoreductase RnfD subunit
VCFDSVVTWMLFMLMLARTLYGGEGRNCFSII